MTGSIATEVIPRRVDKRFDHLLAMSDNVGLFEHARYDQPRHEHGYCVDDVARGLVVLMREPSRTARLSDLTNTYLNFVLAAQAPDGAFHNRRKVSGEWTVTPGRGDWWGRALWGMGAVAAHVGDDGIRLKVLDRMQPSLILRSSSLRSMVFAALGAVEILSAGIRCPNAHALLTDAAHMIGRPGTDPQWRWPETRLAYANAALAEVLIGAGKVLNSSRFLDDGLTMLQWLLSRETNDGILSVTPVGGARRGDARSRFDQQPIEVAALADACVQAARVTGDPSWLGGTDLAARWLFGLNDSLTVMYDEATGAGFDGLERYGRNDNCGAESTLAALTIVGHYGRPHSRISS